MSRVPLSEIRVPPQSSINQPIFKVLILTDSRGTGIQDYLLNAKLDQGLNWSISYNIITKPGATLDCLAAKLVQINSRNQYHFCLLLAGICSLTQKARYNGLKCIDYQDREGKVELIITTIKDLIARFGKTFNIATITPAALEKHFRYWHPRSKPPAELAHQQIELLTDIEHLNSVIVDLNIERREPTINLARQSQSNSKRGNRRKSKFNPKNLEDGIHPNEHLQTVWFNLIAKYIEQKLREYVESESETLESESEFLTLSEANTEAEDNIENSPTPKRLVLIKNDNSPRPSTSTATLGTVTKRALFSDSDETSESDTGNFKRLRKY